MSARIRQIKPAFFKDPDMAALTPATRLFYIGLWCLADDAGFYRWDVADVGVELYGFEPRARRERAAQEHLNVLVAAGRVVMEPCGHLRIPTFAEHQRFAGPTKRVLTYEREHLKCVSPQVPAGPRGFPHIPADPRTGIGIGTVPVEVGNGSSRNGNASPLAPDGAAPRDGESESDFRRRAGLPDFMAVS